MVWCVVCVTMYGAVGVEVGVEETQNRWRSLQDACQITGRVRG